MQGKPQPLICRGFSRPITHIEHSPLLAGGDFYILGACLDGKPQICDGRTGDWVGTLLGHKGAVWCARFDADATHVATASADYTAKYWDAVNGEDLATYNHKGMVKTVTFTPDGKQIVTGGRERVLRLFDLEQPEAAVLEKAESHQSTIKTAAWNSAFHDTVCTACEDNVVRCWDIRSGDLVYKKEMEGSEEVLSLKFSPDGKFMITTAGKRVVFWNAERMEPILSFDTDLHRANAAALNPSADRFVVGCEDFDVYRFDMQGEQLDSHRGHHGPCTAVSYAPDGATFASGAGDGTIRIRLDEVVEYGLWQMGGASKPEPTTPAPGPENSSSEPAAEAPAAATAAEVTPVATQEEAPADASEEAAAATEPSAPSVQAGEAKKEGGE